MYGPPPTKPHTWKPMVAGILLIIAGIDGLTFWAFLAAVAASIGNALPLLGALTALLVICGAIGAIFGILALLGGVMALRRKMWGLALVGSILGLFLVGWGIFVGFPFASLLSFIALILLAISRSEF